MKNLLMFFLCFLILGFNQLHAKENPRLVQVVGIAEEEVLPDTAEIHFNFSLIRDTAQEAETLGNKIKNNLYNRLKGTHVKDDQIITDLSSVHRSWDYQSNKYKQTYTQTYVIRINILNNIQRVSEIRQALMHSLNFKPVATLFWTNKNLNINTSYRYLLKETKDEHMERLLKQAAQNAISKFHVLQGTLDIHKYRIYSITEQEARYSQPPVSSMQFNIMEKSVAKSNFTQESTQLVPSKIKLRKAVLLQMEIED